MAEIAVSKLSDIREELTGNELIPSQKPHILFDNSRYPKKSRLCGPPTAESSFKYLAMRQRLTAAFGDGARSEALPMGCCSPPTELWDSTNFQVVDRHAHFRVGIWPGLGELGAYLYTDRRVV